MTDQDSGSIQQASDLINSALYAKGYFHDSDDGSMDRLKFSTIDKLADSTETFTNDKLVINTIYQLLQELNKSKSERVNLEKQLTKKDETIRSLQNQVDQTSRTNDDLIKKFKEIENEHEVLLEKFHATSKDNHNYERNLNFEKNLNRSIKKKFEIDLNRKNQMISQLQQRLISNNHRIKNLKDNNSTGIDETNLIILQDKIEQLSSQQEKSLIFMNFLVNYLNLLSENKENLPSTPAFYFEHFENQLLLMSQNDNFLIPLATIEKLTFEVLDKFYDLITSIEFTESSNNSVKRNSNSKIAQLEKEVETLKKNLNSALETNEKWSKKFQLMNKNKDV
jgi:chromosome segregation ATPase